MAILQAVPVALARARLRTLDAYARRDGLIDHLVYFRRSGKLPGLRRVARHPTGRVRVATLRLLECSPDGRLRPEDVERNLSSVARISQPPLRLLAALRTATLQ
ncbi:MAG: hypothetical protein HYT80_04080 [Euryarchaeota archaeon]|nr:hypothetical protein [Euryarchaeota archaeon]